MTDTEVQEYFEKERERFVEFCEDCAEEESRVPIPLEDRARLFNSVGIAYLGLLNTEDWSHGRKLAALYGLVSVAYILGRNS